MAETKRPKNKVVVLNRDAAETILELLQFHNVKRPSAAVSDDNRGPSKRSKQDARSAQSMPADGDPAVSQLRNAHEKFNDGLFDADGELLSGTGRNAAKRPVVTDQQERDIMLDFWQRVQMDINTLTYEEMRRPELPVGRVKKVLKFEENLTMVSGTVSIMLAKASEILAAELTQRGYVAMMRAGKKTITKEHIAHGTQGVDHLDFLLDFLPQEALQNAASEGAYKVSSSDDEQQACDATADDSPDYENSVIEAELQNGDVPEDTSLQDATTLAETEGGTPVMLNVKRKRGTNAEAIQVAQGCLREIQTFLQESMGLKMAGNVGKLLETTGTGLLPTSLIGVNVTDKNPAAATNSRLASTRPRQFARNSESTAAIAALLDEHASDDEEEADLNADEEQQDSNEYFLATDASSP